MNIYVFRDNQQEGPMSLDDLEKNVRDRVISTNDLVWREGDADWRPVSELFPSFTPASNQDRSAPPPVPPQDRAKKRFRRISIIALIACAAFYVASPYLAVGSLASALQKGDANSLKAKIDFPEVRTSLKEQIKARMMLEMKKDAKKGDPMGALGEGLAMAFGPSLIDGMVDSAVTPAGISELIKGSKSLSIKSGAPGQASNAQPGGSFDPTKFKNAFFSGPAEFLIQTDDGLKLRFRFRGFGWMLYRIELPPG